MVGRAYRPLTFHCACNIMKDDDAVARKLDSIRFHIFHLVTPLIFIPIILRDFFTHHKTQHYTEWQSTDNSPSGVLPISLEIIRRDYKCMFITI